MKIRFAGTENLASTRLKGAALATLLFFLAFAVVRADYAQEKASSMDKPATGAITDIKAAPENSKLMVTVATDRLLEPQEFLLEDPARLVLDFPGTQNRISFAQLPLRTAAVKKIRIQQFQSTPTPIARVVFDLAEGYGTHEINTNKDGVRLVFYNDKPASSVSSAPRTTTPAPAPVKPLAASSSVVSRPVTQPVATASAASAPRTTTPSPAPVKPLEASPSRVIQPPKPAESAQKSPVMPVATASAAGVPHTTAPSPAPVKLLEASPSRVTQPPKPAESAQKSPVMPVATASAVGVPHTTAPSPAPVKPLEASPSRVIQPPKPAETALKNPVMPPAAAPSVRPSASSIEARKSGPPAVDVKPPRPAEAAVKAPAAQNPVPAASPRTTLARAELPVLVPAQDRKPAPEPQKTLTSADMKPLQTKPELPKAPDPKPVAVQAPPQSPLVAALASNSAPVAGMVTPANSRFSGQPLTLDLIDFPLVDFFRLMSEEGGINIVMDPEIKGRVSIKVVKVPWDQIFEAVLTNNSLDKQVDGSVVRIARKATLQEEAKQQEALKRANLLAADLETRIKRLNYAKAGALAKALEDQKTVRGIIVVEDRSNSLILTDISSSVNKLVQLIEALDVPQPQVEIEARIVSATRDFARDIGIQFGFVDGNLQRVTVGGPNTFGTIGGTRPSATPNSTFAAGNTRTGRGASDDQVTESAAISTGTSTNNKGNYNVNLPATKAFGGLGISIGNIFDTFLLDAAITAGESKGNAKLISQPKVVAQNNSPAVVTQGLRFPVQVIANNTISVQFQNAALTLTVTPQITYEGNIVLDLKVENNTPDFARTVNGIPSIRTSESTTRVLVSDGGTTVIGGILIDDEATQEDKVPGLGSLPIVGNLFRRNSVSRSTQEVLFFVTPRVIK